MANESTSSSASFPEGLEHLDSRRLVDGYEDRGSHALYTRSIVQSPNDECKYRLIRLPNGLEAMLVQDHRAEKYAASLSVRVGHLSDPDELPGLAHFLEHLLFMGSEKYPGENEYGAWLSKNAGHSNAYTSTDQTVYYFDVAPSGFQGALDRFAQFFICPLFKESCVEREIRAVNSEHMKNLQSDGWRLMQLERSLSKNGHPYKKFGTGSLETLWHKPRREGIDVRNELMGFHDKYYSANVMKLAIVTKEPLEQMAALVIELFRRVHNKNLQPQVFPSDPYDVEVHQTRMSVKTVRDSRSLLVQFPFYDHTKASKSRPASLIGHFIGHEGPTSLFTFLKKKGLVLGLGAGHGSPAPGIDFFTVSCGLTKEGLEKHQVVVAAIFEYIKLLKSQPYPEWAFRELQHLNDRAFKFVEAAESCDLAVDLCTSLQEPWSRNEILVAPYILRDFQPQEVTTALGYLDHTRCRVRVASQQPLEGLKWDKKEEWYGTEYTLRKVDDQFFKSEAVTEASFALPKPNPYISQKHDLYGPRDVKEPAARPLCIKRTTGQRIWHKLDDRWKVPKAHIFFKLSNPSIRSSHRSKLLCRFYTYLVNDDLEEDIYDASVAGLHYGLSRGNESLILSMHGYDDKLPLLLKVVVQRMKSLVVKEYRFSVAKENFLRDIDNHSHQSPLEQCSSEMGWLTSQIGHTDEEVKNLLQNVQASDVQKFIPELLAQFHIEAFGHGNLRKSVMYDCFNLVEDTLGAARLSEEKLFKPQSRLLPEKCNYVVQLTASNAEELNNGIQYWLHIGHPKDEELWSRLLLLARLIREPCFDQLRTQEQLGYLVHSGIRSGTSHVAFQISIQSERSPVHLEKRIVSFLESYSTALEQMDGQHFESVKSGLIASVLEDYKTQAEETGWYWHQISSRSYDFFSRQRTAAILKSTSLRDIRDFYAKYIAVTSEHRTKLSIHVYSQRLQDEDVKPVRQILSDHSLPPEDIENVLKSKPRATELHEAIKKLTEAATGLHGCCKEEIPAVAERCGDLPDISKELPGAQAISSADLRVKMLLGAAREPYADYYDGLAKL